MLLFVYLLFFLKEFSAAAGQTIIDVDCYNSKNNGSTFVGVVTETETKTSCLNWKYVNSTYVHFYEDNSFCRNPNNFTKPWCYTNANTSAFGFCNISVCDSVCFKTFNKGSTYSGTIHTAYDKSHQIRQCVTWKSATYQTHLRENHNYCRNPDNSEKPWCYVNSNANEWYYCNVPNCVKKVVINCSPLNSPKFDMVTNRPKYNLNDRVQLRCKSGYKGQDTTATCTAASTWSYKTPTCNPIICQHLIVGEGLVVNGLRSTINFNEPVTLSCKKGFNGTSIQIACNHDGTWPVHRPSCTPLVCQHLIVREGVVVNGLRSTINFNERVTMSCKEGLNGSPMQITCNHDGTWPVQRPTCTPVSCPPLNETEHMDPSMKKTGYHFGNNITFQCVVGYSLSGPPFITCRSSRNKSMGHWSDQQPLCLAVPCPPLNETEHMDPSIKRTGNHFGNNITFQCVSGYRVSGPPFITCRSSRNKSMGYWSDQQPSCLALPCPSLKLPMHSLNKDMIESKIYHVDQNVDFKCEKGYNLIGNGSFKCTVKSNSSVVDWNYEDDQACVEKSKSCKDSTEKRCSCMSYGLFGGTLAVFVAISAGVHIATCFYFRKREGKSATVYEDMQFKTVERQNGNNDETYTELT